MKSVIKSLFVGLVFFLSPDLPVFADPPEVPRLADARVSPRNLSGDETSLGSFMLGNQEILSRIPIKLPGSAQDEMSGRMEDDKLRWELRMLYAVVLANQGNVKAREFLAHQYKTAVDARISDVMLAIYWVWRMPWLDEHKEGNDTKPDMTWAEDIMLAALSDKRTCSVETPFGGDFAVRDLAVHYGHFEMILTVQKCKKALPVLCNYVAEALSLASEEELFPHGFDCEADMIVYSLAKWDDAAVEPVMLEVVRCAIRKRADEWALSFAMDWLVHRKNQTVIGLAKEGLDLDHIYESLAGTRHKPYLEAIRGKLENLTDGSLTDEALYRQRYARAHAELILIMGEEADPIPKLMKFAEDLNNEKRYGAIHNLKALKDPRCVAWAEKMVAAEQDWFVSFCLIELLSENPGNDATVALVNLLDLPFNKIKPTEGTNYSARDYHDRIRKELEKRTGKQFGTDSDAWRKWLSNDER